jgi:hypothetical protein
MSIINKFIRNGIRPSTKQLVSAGIFTLALATSVGLGIASRGFTSASVIRDTDSANSIDGANINGGIGAADATEFIKDVRANNPNDLQKIYADPQIGGLTSDKYDEFQKEAVEGTLWRDGHITVGNQTVWNNVWTLGRTTMGMGSDKRQPITIGGKTYYHSVPELSFAESRKSLPVMVWFNDRGEVQMAVMNACGNGIGGGTKVKNAVTCKALKQTQPDASKKPNTYQYTTDVTVAGNAQISRVVYHFTDDNSTITKTGANAGTQVVEHTFTKDADVTVTVYASVPGGHEIQAAQIADCAKKVKYVPPFYVCTNLVATAIDNSKKAFRFTVNTKTDTTGQTTLKDVDFTLDGKDSTKSTSKDANGNVYKEYTFTDDKEHTVKASVNFNTAQGVQSVTCEAKVTPTQTPKCTVPGHENEAPDSPNCGYCQPNIPIGDTRCTPPQVESASTTMPSTGPGNIVGTFVGVAVVGFIAHNIFLRRRASRQ